MDRNFTINVPHEFHQALWNCTRTPPSALYRDRFLNWHGEPLTLNELSFVACSASYECGWHRRFTICTDIEDPDYAEAEKAADDALNLALWARCELSKLLKDLPLLQSTREMNEPFDQ